MLQTDLLLHAVPRINASAGPQSVVGEKCCEKISKVVLVQKFTTLVLVQIPTDHWA